MDFERLADRHKDAVYRQMLRMCGNHEDAEDVLVESLVKAYQAAQGLKTEEAFKAWLAQIARRTCGRLKHREAARPLLKLDALGPGWEPSSGEPTPEVAALEAETKRCVQEALDSLPSIYADIYVLRDVEGLTAEESARRLGITVAAVKSRLHRARTMLRERIDRALVW